MNINLVRIVFLFMGLLSTMHWFEAIKLNGFVTGFDRIFPATMWCLFYLTFSGGYII